MRVLFLARHGSGDNDDEGAVLHALRILGHEVTCVHESPRHRGGVPLEKAKADLCLFFKHPTVSEIADLSQRMPCAYWHFDMIRSVEGDPTLAGRSEHRVRWCQDVLPHVVAGFHTDGDWVAADKSGKLVHLTQGADERVAGFGEPRYHGTPEVLFTGMVHHGRRRASHVADLRDRYGERFGVLGDGGPKYRRHGRDLADTFASTKVVVAPDGPTTNRYTSNRAYLTLSLGGFLIHPYTDVLARQYREGAELVMYRSRKECFELIDYYLDRPEERERLRRAGFEATMQRCLYRHRVADLMREVQRRI